MKISYRTHFGIKIIETGFFVIKTINDADKQFSDALLAAFQQQKDRYKPIKIISKNMAEVLLTTADKMIKDEVWDNVGHCNGSIIMNGFTYCYFIKSNGKPEHDHSVFIFYGSDFVGYGWQNVETNKRITIVSESMRWILKYTKPDGQDRWQETVFDGLYTTLISAINFLKYAEIEDKEVKANSKEKGFECKYINETNTDIRYITSHYIHNLYVRGSFKVKGHWRLQPKKKDGEWTKELIWINDFQKEGYTRKAGILKD